MLENLNSAIQHAIGTLVERNTSLQDVMKEKFEFWMYEMKQQLFLQLTQYLGFLE